MAKSRKWSENKDKD